KGRIVDDTEIKGELRDKRPWRRWLDENLINLESLPEPQHVHQPDHDTLMVRQHAFGYTVEDLKMIMMPMATGAAEAIGSMGTDTPLACLSEKPQLLYAYFRQLFAQVTNPPLDAIREELVTAMRSTLGQEQSLFTETPEHCHQLALKQPILNDAELKQIESLNEPGLKAITIPL